MRTRRLAPAFAALAVLSIPAAALANKAPPPRAFEIKDNRLVVTSRVWFSPDTAKVDNESLAGIAYVARYLAEKTYITSLRIEVHADSSGDAGEAQTLSEQRALAVAKALVKEGADCKRLVPVGFGNTKPIADNATPEGRAQNRRVEFVNAGLRGREIGGMPLDGGGKIAGDPCAK